MIHSGGPSNLISFLSMHQHGYHRAGIHDTQCLQNDDHVICVHVLPNKTGIKLEGGLLLCSSKGDQTETAILAARKICIDIFLFAKPSVIQSQVCINSW